MKTAGERRMNASNSYVSFNFSLNFTRNFVKSCTLTRNFHDRFQSIYDIYCNIGK